MYLIKTTKKKQFLISYFLVSFIVQRDPWKITSFAHMYGLLGLSS